MIERTTRAQKKKEDDIAKVYSEEFVKDDVIAVPSSGSESESDSEDVSETEEEPQPSLGGHSITKATVTNDKKQPKSKFKKGVIYIGRIPHGFHEDEMKKYFTQFGDISRLRLSRNKKTGKSKHYGFIEFQEHEVAKIAAETMNNYLIFGHLLQCSLLDQEKVSDDMFNGANTKFKKVPWTSIARNKNDKPKSLAKWKKLAKAHEDRKKSKQEALAKLGIDISI